MLDHDYTTEQASNEAFKWCQSHPGWKRICDIQNIESLYKTWKELPARVRDLWEYEFPGCAKDAWTEFGIQPCKVRFGFVSGSGNFYRSILKVPPLHQFMMVFNVNDLKTGG